MKPDSRTVLATLDYSQLAEIASMHAFFATAYNATGNKFSMNWHGSKGYLSHLEIRAEGVQESDTNRIFCDKLFTKTREWRKCRLVISYSHKTGVHLETA